MTKTPYSFLTSPDELQTRLQGAHPPIMVDATYSNDGLERFMLGRIGQVAAFFDIDDVADHEAPLPHTAPNAITFADKVGALGISANDDLVIYDQSGIFMAASRAWWLFRLFGHKGRVQVLNGGLPAWVHAGGQITQADPVNLPQVVYETDKQPALLVEMDELLSIHKNSDVMVLDARAEGRFHGVMPEPRPGMRAGHIPNSANLPFGNLLNQSGALPDAAMLQMMLASYLHTPQRLITSCGSGVTACVLALALAEAGRSDVAVYDGSWTEWGSEAASTPVAQSA